MGGVGGPEVVGVERFMSLYTSLSSVEVLTCHIMCTYFDLLSTAAKLPTPIIPPRLPVPTSIDFVSIGSKSVTFMITVPNSVGNELHVEFTSHDGHKIQSNGIMGDTIAIKSLSGLHPGTTYTVRAFVVEGSTQGQAKVSAVTTKEDGELHSIDTKFHCVLMTMFVVFDVLSSFWTCQRVNHFLHLNKEYSSQMESPRSPAHQLCWWDNWILCGVEEV